MYRAQCNSIFRSAFRFLHLFRKRSLELSFLTEDFQLHGPVRYNSVNTFRSVDDRFASAGVQTLPGYFQFEPTSGGAQTFVSHIDVREYVGLVAVVHVDASPDGFCGNVSHTAAVTSGMTATCNCTGNKVLELAFAFVLEAGRQ